MDIKDLNFNPFSKIGDEWALLGAASGNEKNAMTVSWGEVGVLWNKPIFTVFVRPTRYTYSLLEKTDVATLSFFDKDYKKTLSYFGTVSGKNEDKLTFSKIGHRVENGALLFDDATLSFVGRKLYYSDVDPRKFTNPDLDLNYPQNDYHRVYVYEIVDAVKKEA